MSSLLDVTMFRGDSYPLTFTLRDSITGALVDLTGASVKMTVDSRKNPDDETTLLFEQDGIVTDPESGEVVFWPTTADTATIGRYYYDLQLLSSNGSIRTVIKAVFAIIQDITK